MSDRPLRSAVVAILKVTVSVALMAWLLSSVDVARLRTRASGVSIGWLAVALVVYFANILASTWRWRLLLDAQNVHVPRPSLLSSYLVAGFFNNFLPSNIGGDVVRIRDTARQAGSKTIATAVVLVRGITVTNLASILGAVILIGLLNTLLRPVVLALVVPFGIVALGVVATALQFVFVFAVGSLVPGLRVVARAVPEQKLRLVEAARTAGRTVAVTGDGVNDAPALHRADVAVAMGSGTQVAREAADLVLGDDSFGTLMHGLREGRRMVENIRKGLVFLISTHVALLGFILIATLAGHGQPLLPVQILWLELFIDVSTSVAFERESEEPGAMRRPPRPRGTPLLPVSMLVRIGFAGGFTAVAALVLMEARGGGEDHARWLAYTALVVGQVIRANANRSLSVPVLKLRRNTFIAAAALLVVLIQVAIPFVPPLADAFRATPLDAVEWGIVLVIGLVPAVVADVARRLGQTWVA